MDQLPRCPKLIYANFVLLTAWSITDKKTPHHLPQIRIQNVRVMRRSYVNASTIRVNW